MKERTTAEKEAIEQYRKVLRQWNERSANGFAAGFTENGIFIAFDGSLISGRKEIFSVMDEIFSNFPTAAYVHIVKDVYTVTPNVIHISAVVGMVAHGDTDITPTVNAVQIATVVRDNDEWLLSMLQNTPAAFHGRAELSQKLTDDLRLALLANN